TQRLSRGWVDYGHGFFGGLPPAVDEQAGGYRVDCGTLIHCVHPLFLALHPILEVLSTIRQHLKEVQMVSLSPLLKQATPVTVDYGRGSELFDVDGTRYLDFTAGIGVTSTGHCHPRVAEAAQKQVGSLIHGQYTTVMHKPLLELVDKLGTVLPSGLDSLFFANSGSEAVEAALRLSRQATKRPDVIAFHGGFHGRTVATASMTS